MKRPTDNPTPRRLEVLRSVHQFGMVVCTVQSGWQTHIKAYTVSSLTELVDSTEVIKTCRKLGWMQRTHAGSTVYELTDLGRQIMEQNR